MGLMINSTGAQGQEPQTIWRTFHVDGPGRQGYRHGSCERSRPQVAMANTCATSCSIEQHAAQIGCQRGAPKPMSTALWQHTDHKAGPARMWAQEAAKFRPGFRNRLGRGFRALSGLKLRHSGPDSETDFGRRFWAPKRLRFPGLH